jgi:hypothetical protein
VDHDFAAAVQGTLAAARDHAARLSRLPSEEHRRLCEQLEARVVAIFEEAQAASAGFLRFHRKLDANGAAVIYGLSVQRDVYRKTCLFIRVDATHVQTWWQLHEDGNLEHALGGWWNLPVLAVEDQDAFLQARVLDPIWTLREASTSHRSRS